MKTYRLVMTSKTPYLKHLFMLNMWLVQKRDLNISTAIFMLESQSDYLCPFEKSTYNLNNSSS